MSDFSSYPMEYETADSVDGMRNGGAISRESGRAAEAASELTDVVGQLMKLLKPITRDDPNKLASLSKNSVLDPTPRSPHAHDLARHADQVMEQVRRLRELTAQIDL